MKSTFVTVLSLLLLLSVQAYTQSPGKSKPAPTSRTRPVAPAVSQPPKTTLPKPNPALPAEPLAEPADVAVGQHNEEQLRQLEAQNEAIIRREGAEAAYYRMNRSSMTVLPVIIQVPGLWKTDDKGKPIYTRSELFRRRQVQPLTGDMLVSAKHHYNTVRFDMQSVFTKLLQDSTNFYALTKLPAPKTGFLATGKINQQSKSKVTSATPPALKQEIKRGMGDYLAGKDFTTQEGPFEAALRESLTRGNVGTSILKIWTNKTVLMERIMMTQKEADRVERVDIKKMAVWQNMLRKNYIVVLALINPHMDVDHSNKTTTGQPTKTYKSDVEAFLFHVDTARLDINNIRNQHNLRFVGRLSAGTIECDPRSEEFAETLGSGSIETMQDKVKLLVASDLRHQADLFYQAKSYECAKNYYTYVLSAKPSDSADIQKIIDKCSAQLARSSRSSADSTCLASETSLFDEWVYGQGASNTIIQDFERYIKDLRVMSYVVKTKPMIAAEIGHKEGVFVDQRFLVYRKTIDKNGVVGQQRIGTLRAVRVSANTSRFDQVKAAKKSPVSGIQMTGLVPDMFRSITTSPLRSDSSQRNTTRPRATKSPAAVRQSLADSIIQRDLTTMTLFKQVDGGHIESYDLIEQNDDYGVGLLVGYGLKLGVTAFTLGGDVRLGRILPGLIPVPGIRLGFNASFLNKEGAQKEWKVAKDKTTAFEIYLARELYLSPRFDLKPLAGVSIFNDTYNPMLGMAALINISGRNSNTKVKLAPDISYVLGYTYQANVNLKFDF